MAWKAHFVISDEPFTVTEEEEGKGTGDGRFFCLGRGTWKAFLSDSLYFHSETRVEMYEEWEGVKRETVDLHSK